MVKKKDSIEVPVESIRHKDKRVNIPTEELRDFVDQENKPESILYPRDTSLDPQLVWKGKDEQNAKPLSVPSVPIYIQEKIHPQAIIEDFLKQYRDSIGKKTQKQASLDLFSDFNGLPEEFDQRVDFYHHDQHWSNRMILGDSLLVMSSLSEKEGLKGKVQMIYIDPPYGIKFGSNWQVRSTDRDNKGKNIDDVTREPEQIKAYRDTWSLGINSYLSYLRDRFVLARELLTESGSIFVQIGEENVHLVRSVLDEVFGPDNYCSVITYAKTKGATAKGIACVCDYILWYSKSKEQYKFRRCIQLKSLGEDGTEKYYHAQSSKTLESRILTTEERQGLNKLSEEWAPILIEDLTSQSGGESTSFEYSFRGKKYLPSTKRGWRTNLQGMERLAKSGRLTSHENTLMFKRFLQDYSVNEISNLWGDTTSGASAADPKVYVVQTRTLIVQRCILMSTDPGDLVIDPTCGSGTTAYVAEQWGRRWITIDTSRVALALARTRLMSAKYPFYVLEDSPEGVEKESEIVGHKLAFNKPMGDIRKGFVNWRVPHLTLRSIANNEQIDSIHNKWIKKQEPLLHEINKVMGKNLEEWEIPRLSSNNFKLEPLLKQWWELMRQRQKEIDESIAQTAETEVLYDKPYEDKKRVRVTGPFTVESLSPHRVLPTEEKESTKKIAGAAGGKEDFVPMILDNLRQAGVQNTKKHERIKFDSLDPFPGEWVNAAGTFTDGEGNSKRIAVSIGPEFGTISPLQIKKAAMEAVKGIPFNVLVVCGFAFDPHVSEEVKNYGTIQVLAVRMSPDLLMGEELKKTDSANLFTVFGEPDILIEKKDGKITLDIRGVDVYDPTTGVIRSSSTDDIACWFIDTDYNGESFFVRHAYFTGADEPYEKLKKTLRAEIDEAAWSSIYSTKSRPFDPPSNGKIAVKVINHYGDEVLKVFTM
ncbi:MAG: site-specific DNA-methyltransferase [Methanomassiliicoccales archaeon]|jgi:adenine-specific DNA-methyltransferase